MKRAGKLTNAVVGGFVALAMLGTSELVFAGAAYASTTMAATTWVNMRSGPGTSHGVVRVLSPNEAVTAGTNSGGWYQVTTGQGQSGWVYQTYLTASGTAAPAPTTPPGASGQATTIAAVNVRSGPGTSHAVVGVAAKGSTLPTTGKTSGGWTEVVWAGQARWISTNYLTTAARAATRPPSTSVALPGYDRLNANAKAGVRHVLATYPLIRRIGGYRASSSYSSDHPSGRAIDAMVSNWSQQSGIDYGTALARDFAANASTYKVTYIMWRQQVWNASYPERGWRSMADRGSATQNHYDHVHVSFRD